MLRRFVDTARVCGVGIALSSLLGGAVHAADFSTKAAPVPYAEDDFWTRPYLFGDLGRTQLKERGIDLGLTLGNESVGNVTGGSRNTAANAGQLWFGAKLDMGKLAGIQGGTVGLTLVDRFGKNLNTEADIPALQLTNEVFGRGNILRLTQLYYSQKLFDDRLELKGGRLPVGSDFFFGLCEFINLTFCGGQPGNIQGGYIYNWPVSQWAGVVHYKLAPEFTISVGVYDANPNYLTTSDPSIYFLPGIPASNPATGLLVPVELTWSPSGPLFGTWRFGGWYDNASTIDGGLPGIIAAIPGVGGVRRHRRARMHFDLHLRGDRQLAMRLCQLDAQHRIAEGVEFIRAALRRGFDADLVLQALLVGSRARHQVQQVMGMHHVGGVAVTRLVADAVLAAHVARARASDSMSAK